MFEDAFSAAEERLRNKLDGLDRIRDDLREEIEDAEGRELISDIDRIKVEIMNMIPPAGVRLDCQHYESMLFVSAEADPRDAKAFAFDFVVKRLQLASLKWRESNGLHSDEDDECFRILCDVDEMF